MEDKLILTDTSILIDFFRKTDKSNSKLISLIRRHYSFVISAITEYEIFSGAKQEQYGYWTEFLERTKVLPFDTNVAKIAVQINADLKKKNKQIDIADLFIGATAVVNNLPFATLNKKHFERIENLRIIE